MSKCFHVKVGPVASFLGIVGVQPRAVLLHLPPDHQEHLRHVLRELLAEEGAAPATGGGGWGREREGKREGR